MSRSNTSKLVSFTQSSGVEININLVLEENLRRQNQKLQTLTQYVQKYPSGWKKRLELANLLYAMGSWEQGVEEYRQVLVQQPQLIEVRLKLGKILQLMGKKAEAVEVYESALLYTPHPTPHTLFQVSEPTRRHILGLIAVCQGDTQGAILAFESAASQEPSNPSHWLALGQVQMAREDAVAALQAFDAVLSLQPDDLVALLTSYDALLAVGNLRAAEGCLSRGSELAGDDFRVLKRQAHQRCGKKLVRGKEGKQTKQIITAALKLAVDAPDVHDLLAYYYIFRGDWRKGVRVLQQFTESHPNNANGWYYYGRCLFHTGQYQRALKAMLLAHRLYPDDCEIYRGLCDIFTSLLPREGSRSNLMVIVEQMLEKFPERWSVWPTTGRILVNSLGEIERGCQVSEEGTRLQPQLPNAWFCHGRVLALGFKYGEAVEALEKGWELSKLHLTPSLVRRGERGEASYNSLYVQSLSAAVWLGESYQGLGDDGRSRKWLEKVCDLADDLQCFDPAMASYWQGRAFVGLGDLAGAMEAYGCALSEQLLFPVRGEVEGVVKWLKGKLRKGAGG
ncbi:MAG: tetratricopeptide repeat protein [Calothrix sp. MO_192.B10]|nr:tetratricopeptide repeat protein [Calothrix sp. MO_192.B10]